MKILCGTDIVLVSRLSKYAVTEGKLPHFLTRCFTPSEIEYCLGKKNEKSISESLAGRFAAKEAVAKALGTGVMTMGIGFTDIEILNDKNGAPFVKLGGAASQKVEELGVRSVSISISHDGDYAVAFCTMLSSEDVG